MTTDNQLLASRLEQLEKNNTELRIRVDIAEDRNRRERRRLRVQAGLAFAALIATALVSPTSRSAIAQGYGVTLASLNTRLAAVENKTRFQTADATAKCTTFSGCNLTVNDGGGSTLAVVTNANGEGIGNLIIGYDAYGRDPNFGGDVRTGSHNLILGDENNYNSYGGFVAGTNNSVYAPYASVSGGAGNTADGHASSVSGGEGNGASGTGAAVSGGFGDIALSDYSSVVGGYYNTADATCSTIDGGSNNTTTGLYSTISGGYLNAAVKDCSSVSGGANNTANKNFSSVSGGQFNTANQNYSSVSGGFGVANNTQFGWTGGSQHSP